MVILVCNAISLIRIACDQLYSWRRCDMQHAIRLIDVQYTVLMKSNYQNMILVAVFFITSTIPHHQVLCWIMYSILVYCTSKLCQHSGQCA